MFKFLFTILFLPLFFVSNKKQHLSDWYYWGVKYNDSILYSSTNHLKKRWEFSLKKSIINTKDSIELFLNPDCCYYPPVAILLKDSMYRFVRRFENTTKVAVKDVVRYGQDNGSKIVLFWTAGEKNKTGTVNWNDQHRNPYVGYSSPYLFVTIQD